MRENDAPPQGHMATAAAAIGAAGDLRAWGVTVAALAAAALLRWLLDPWLDGQFPLVTFFPMTVLIALFVGARQATAAMVLSALLAPAVFVDADRADAAHAVVFALAYALASAVLIVAIARTRGARARAEQLELEARRRERTGAEHQILLQGALDSADAGLHSFDAATGAAHWDSRLRELFGLGPDAGVGPQDFLKQVHADDRDRVSAAVHAALEAHGSRRYAAEFRILRVNDGAQRWIKSTGFGIFDGERLVRLVGMARDVTEQRTAEEALRLNAERLRLAAESAGFGILDHDIRNDTRWWSPELYSLTGVAVGTPPSRALALGLIHEADRDRVTTAMAAALDPMGSGQFISEFRIVRADTGEERWLSVRAQVRFAAEGTTRRPVRQTGVLFDVTARREAAAALRAQRDSLDRQLAELDSIYAQAAVGLCVLDRDLRYLRINERLATMNGMPAAAHLGRTVMEVLPELQHAIVPLAKRVLAGEAIQDFELVGETRAHPGVQHTWIGSWVPLRQADGGIWGINLVVEEVTAQRAVARQLELALRASGMGTWVYRLDGEPSVVDARTLELFGHAEADWNGDPEPLLAHIHPADHSGVMEALTMAIRNHQPYEHEFRVNLPDGRIRWLAGFGRTEYDAAGRAVLMRGTNFDVTAKRESEQALRDSEHRFATLADGAPVLLWVLGPDGAEYVNRVYLEFVGVERQADVHGYDWARFIHPEDRDAYLDAYREAFANRRYFAAELRFRRHDGVYRWMRTEATPRFGADGEFCGFVGATVDITERRAAEDRLLMADKQKDQFLATLAHELRNPLAPIRNASEVLALRYAGDPQAAVPLAMLRRQSDHLVRLLDDLLDVTRIAQGRMTLKREPVEVGAVINQAVETVAQQLRTKQLRLGIERDPGVLTVRGDRARLVQCLTNVLHNAVKFTQEGGAIDLTARSNGPDIEITVKDNGMGIAPELVPHVFELFVQSERTLDRSEGGLGIGLSVVKRVIELHGGSVRADSAGPGRGTTIRLKLPRIEPTVAPELRMTSSGAGRRVLVIDDSTDAADSLAMLLKLEGHDVETVYSAGAGLEAAERWSPDVAFIDIGLPDIDGYELARRLRANVHCRAIRLVALTGYGQPGDREQARAAGFDHHLIKPADLGALSAILSRT